MNLFYNPNGVGDVAFLQIEPAEGEFNYRKNNDVVEITKEDDNQVVGYNFFNISNHIQIEGNGHIKLTEDIVEQLQQMIKNNGFTLSLIHI